MDKKDLNRLINRRSLEENGYEKCPGTLDFKPTASNLFTKTVRSPDNKKMYFIHVYEFDFQDTPHYSGDPLRYSAEVRFYRKHQSWDTDMVLSNTTTFKEMEDFFMETFIAMNCDYDHHNN